MIKAIQIELMKYPYQKLQRAIYFFIVQLMIISCSQNETLERNILGKWEMEKVYEYDQDVTSKHNPNNNRWIMFNEDGTFISDGDPFGRNTGRWTTDDENSTIFIDSDVDDDDSEWKVTLQNNTSIWTGLGQPRKENTKLVFSKTAND